MHSEGFQLVNGCAWARLGDWAPSLSPGAWGQTARSVPHAALLARCAVAVGVQGPRGASMTRWPCASMAPRKGGPCLLRPRGRVAAARPRYRYWAWLAASARALVVAQSWCFGQPANGCGGFLGRGRKIRRHLHHRHWGCVFEQGSRWQWQWQWQWELHGREEEAGAVCSGRRNYTLPDRSREDT